MSMIVSRCANRLFRVSSTHVCLNGPFLSTERDPRAEKKTKKPPEIRINLIENTSLTVMSMESALKVANKRNAQLTEVEKPAHWMLVGNRKAFQFLDPGKKVAKAKDEDVKAQGFRGIKHALFGVSIQENDIKTKINRIIKWIKSGYVIDVAMDTSDRSDEIRSSIEESIRDIAKLPGTVKRDSEKFFRILYEPIDKPAIAKKS